VGIEITTEFSGTSHRAVAEKNRIRGLTMLPDTPRSGSVSTWRTATSTRSKPTRSCAECTMAVAGPTGLEETMTVAPTVWEDVVDETGVVVA
jgi:hypothetical protein